MFSPLGCRRGGYVPERYEVAKLSGFDIRIQPLATLVRSDQHCVYGIVAQGTHEQLRRLYSQDWVGTYQPGGRGRGLRVGGLANHYGPLG
jgi:hypothetical protein